MAVATLLLTVQDNEVVAAGKRRWMLTGNAATAIDRLELA